MAKVKRKDPLEIYTARYCFEKDGTNIENIELGNPEHINRLKIRAIDVMSNNGYSYVGSAEDLAKVVT